MLDICDAAFLEEVESRFEIDGSICAATFPRLLELAKTRTSLKNLAEKLLRIKRAADGEDALMSCQGQGMDGYSELANYRFIIENIQHG